MQYSLVQSALAGLLIISVTLFSSCSLPVKDGADTETSDVVTPDNRCPNARPQICTMSYDPVCATHRDGHTSTRSNNCQACSHADIVSYRFGACGP